MGIVVQKPGQEEVPKGEDAYNARLDDDIAKGCLLDPRTTAMGRWDAWVTLLLIFTTYVTPYEVAYLGNDCLSEFDQAELAGLETKNTDTTCSAARRWSQMTNGAIALFMINRLVDLSFFVDMIKTFFTSYFDESRQEWVTDHRVIALKYTRFWFTIDLVSILPFDMMSFFTSNEALENAKGARLIRLLRLLKLLRILRGARILAKWQDYFGWSHNSVQLGQFLVCVLTMIHWCACLLRMVPDLEEYTSGFEGDPLAEVDEKPRSWMTEYAPISTLANIDKCANIAAPHCSNCNCIKYSPESEQYVAALYWATMTLTTIGYGDIGMNTNGERVFATLCMIICGAIYAYAIGSICGLITNTDEATQEFNKNSDLLNAYCSEHHLDGNLTIRLREFFRNCKPFYRNEHYRDLLSMMSPTLQGEVIAHTFADTWREVPFFQLGSGFDQQHEQKEFLTRICLAMTAQITGPKEVVFSKGERMRGMYVIQAGVAFKCISFDEPFQLYGTLEQGIKYKRNWVEELNVCMEKQQRVLEVMATRANPSFFGTEGVLMNRRYAYEVRAHNFLHTLMLLKADLDMVLATNEFPNVMLKVRRALVKTILKLSVRRLVSVLAETPETEEEKLKREADAATAESSGTEVAFFDAHTVRVLEKLQDQNEFDAWEAEKTKPLETQQVEVSTQMGARIAKVEEKVGDLDAKLGKLLAHFQL